MTATLPVGSIAWLDITTDSAVSLRDFYRNVIGWIVDEFDMGGYQDYVMKSPHDNAPVAGVCHARGVNAALPSHWLAYVVVTNLEESIERCLDLGGRVHTPPRDGGSMGRFCVIQDPAGALLALLTPPTGK